jgi:hypothetical protein
LNNGEIINIGTRIHINTVFFAVSSNEKFESKRFYYAERKQKKQPEPMVKRLPERWTL